MESYYIEHSENRVSGTSQVAKRYIRDIQYILWKHFDQVIIPDTSFRQMQDEFETYLKKLVGRHNPDFKINCRYRYPKQISFLVNTPEGWCTYSKLAVSPIAKVSSLDPIKNI